MRLLRYSLGSLWIACCGLAIVAISQAKQAIAVARVQSTTPRLTPKLDLNKATVEELAQVHGLGRVRAQALVAWRKDYGPFKTIADLRQVKGFGAASIERFGVYFTVYSEPSIEMEAGR